MTDQAIDQQTIEYPILGGTLTGKLYAPKGGGPYPAVIALHGGGWRLANLDAYQHLGPWLARRGYVVLAATYRMAKPGTKTYPGAVHDVRSAVQFVKGKAAALNVEPDRIALIGESAGGHLASLVALAGDHPRFAEGGGVSAKVKAAVSVYGVHDLARQWQHDQVSRPLDHITELFVGKSLVEDRQSYFDASPLSYVTLQNNTTAFFVAWGTEDDIVDHREQSEAFVLALKQARFFVRTAVVSGAPHYWLSDPLDEPGSYSGFFAPRLLRFLKARL